VNSLLIAWKDFKIRIKDRKGFLTMILMPLVLTAILGAALQAVMGGDGGFSETTLGIYEADQDPLAETFRKEVLPELPFITVKMAESEDELQDMLRDGSIDAGLSFPKQWSADLSSGRLKEASLLSTSDTQLKASVIESLIHSFTERVQTVSSASQTVLNDLAHSAAVSSAGSHIKDAGHGIVTEIANAAKQETRIKEEAVGQKMVSSMQYYAAAMAVMFVLFNATMGAKSIIEERSAQTLSRLMVTPTGNISILTGKFLGTLLFALIQLAIFFTATSLFFRVNWGDHFLQTAAVGLAYAVAVSGLSMLLAAVVTDAKTTDVISGVGVQIFAILGGSMLPIYLFPESLQALANITPNKWALTGFLNIMSGAAWTELAAPILVLTSMGIVSLAAGTWRLHAR
jgi:ABC-2 type transport system permease protein